MMTDTEKNKLGMYESVLLFLSENSDVVNTVKAFSWSIFKLRKIIDEIKLHESKLSNKTLESIIKASKARDELINILTLISPGLSDLALETNNSVLKHQSKLTISALSRMLDGELIDKAVDLKHLVQNYSRQLIKHKVAPSRLEELKITIENFIEALNNKAGYFISNNALLEVSNLFADADKILSSYMDSFAEALSDKFPGFYYEYLWARSIRSYDKVKTVIDIEEEEN